jgi:hypothetical protein
MKRILAATGIVIVAIVALAVVTQAANLPPDRVERWMPEARATVTVQDISRSARLVATYSAIGADGVNYANDGDVILHCKNIDVSNSTITVQTAGTIDGVAIADPTFVVSATTGMIFMGPFNPSYYNQSDGTVYVDSSVTDGDTTCAALRVSR